MKSIMAYSLFCKKFSPEQEEKLKQKFYALSKETEGIEKGNLEFIDHTRAVRELISTTFWVFVVLYS